MKEVDRLGDVGPLDDADAMPGLGVHFEGRRPSRNARRDWRRDAQLQRAINGHLLEDDHSP